MGNFRLDLDKFGAKAKGKAGLIVRKVSLDLLRGVVFRTPVDTGRARANWQVSVGEPASGEVAFQGGAGAAASVALSAGASAVGQVQGDVSIYLTNNVPYIVGLENGHSKQAPDGMVRQTIATFPYLVEQAAQA